MNVRDARTEFIETWGALATQWGISRSMAQIHAVLLVSPEAMTTDEIMEALEMSRGGVSTNVRELIDWGIVQRITKKGERRELFEAEKDIWVVARKIMQERKRRELDPVAARLRGLASASITGPAKDVEAFRSAVKDLSTLTKTASDALDTMSKAETAWLVNLAMKVIR
ncbi:MAG: transcriptional regulator [Ignavibacteria bacterium]|nr:transcriptional regulator [Ignavibacteria bacterium]MBK6418954.1 transcriptional regulator [Ignavibacteria bacterium]MBK7033892.1 transcriptional regulator [Ignavibacteria bacterium]MBK7411860.1 transcriptional regulator [Ignavibacteria bacterium]MBL0322808.1 transcriptional regulator [Ignavibacteria bacterium]